MWKLGKVQGKDQKKNIFQTSPNHFIYHVVQVIKKLNQMQHGRTVRHTRGRPSFNFLAGPAHNLKPLIWRKLWRQSHICQWTDFMTGFGVGSTTQNLTKGVWCQFKMSRKSRSLSAVLFVLYVVIWLLLTYLPPAVNTWGESSTCGEACILEDWRFVCARIQDLQ